MSFIDKLIGLFHEGTLGKLSDERQAQYTAIFSDSVEQTWSIEGGRKYFEQLRDKLLHANPSLKELVGHPPVLQLNTSREITGVKKHRDESAIVIDTFLPTLLWTMNKVWIYGSELDSSIKGKLYCELFLNFATQREFGECGVIWPRPKTPPHTDKALMTILVFLTGIQESFLIGHELAHLYIDGGGSVPADFQYLSDFPTSYTMLSERNASIDQELLADEFALNYVLNAYSRELSVEVVVVTSIFLLIRYQLWLSVVCSTEEGSSSFLLWFGRNSLFRQKIRQICSDEAQNAVVEVCEALEEHFEPAALRAKKAMKLLREKVGDFSSPLQSAQEELGQPLEN